MLALVAVAATIGWYVVDHGRPPAVIVDSGQASGAASETTAVGGQASLPSSARATDAAQSPTTASSGTVGSAAIPPVEPRAQDSAAGQPPSFDVVRVEPNGDSVIAGRAAPGATVDLMRNGQSIARAMADQSGLFAIVPPPLAAGAHEIVLQAIAPDGARTRSAQSVTVVVAADRTRAPLVTVTAPDQPTVILSQPDDAPPSSVARGGPETGPGAAGEPGAIAGSRSQIQIATVEAQEGHLFVSGSAAPNATVRLYLNDSFVAPASATGDGRLSFSIGKGVRPGEYRVRLDDVDPVSGAVRSRAEVPFTVPPPVATAAGVGDGLTPPDGRTAIGPETAPAGHAGPSTGSGNARTRVATTAPASAEGGPVSVLGDPGHVVVPEINTAMVARGDNLWRISKRVYGKGLRYTVIFGANSPQIRNPNLIYPGQVFVVPGQTQDAKR